MDLDDGQSAVFVDAAASFDDLPRRPSRTAALDTTRWWLPLVAGLAVVVLVLAGLAIGRIGPFAPPPDAARLEPNVDIEAYDTERVLLELSDIATKTTAPPRDGRSFTAAQMVDDDPGTAWLGDGAELDQGVGEIIDLVLLEPAWVEMVLIRNGDHHSPDHYERAARVDRALVTFDGGVRFVLNLLDHGRTAQVVELPAPVLTTSARIEILESFPGEAGSSVAIADLELRGRVAGPEDAAKARDQAQATSAASNDHPS